MSLVDGLRFETGAPEVFVDRFDEIQDLRVDHYANQLRGWRTPEEIAFYIGRLTAEKWSIPNAAVGNTAREGQRRAKASVTMAFDDKTDDVVGFTYAAENVSSRLERYLAKFRVPARYRTPVGDWERNKKLEKDRYFVWGSEYVHDPQRPELAHITTGLCLEGFNLGLAGTWWPWTDEGQLFRNLGIWGYKSAVNKGEMLEGKRGFGEGSAPTYQWMYRVPHVRFVVDVINNLPDIKESMVEARNTLR